MDSTNMDAMDIYSCLLKGWPANAKRGSGKTRALAHILLNDPNAVVICATNQNKQQLEEYCRKLRINPRGRCFAASTENSDLFTQGKRIFVDERSRIPWQWWDKYGSRVYAYTVDWT